MFVGYGWWSASEHVCRHTGSHHKGRIGDNLLLLATRNYCNNESKRGKASNDHYRNATILKNIVYLFLFHSTNHEHRR